MTLLNSRASDSSDIPPFIPFGVPFGRYIDRCTGMHWNSFAPERTYMTHYRFMLKFASPLSKKICENLFFFGKWTKMGQWKSGANKTSRQHQMRKRASCCFCFQFHFYTLIYCVLGLAFATECPKLSKNCLCAPFAICITSPIHMYYVDAYTYIIQAYYVTCDMIWNLVNFVHSGFTNTGYTAYIECSQNF